MSAVEPTTQKTQEATPALDVVYFYACPWKCAFCEEADRLFRELEGQGRLRSYMRLQGTPKREVGQDDHIPPKARYKFVGGHMDIDQGELAVNAILRHFGYWINKAGERVPPPTDEQMNDIDYVQGLMFSDTTGH